MRGGWRRRPAWRWPTLLGLAVAAAACGAPPRQANVPPSSSPPSPSTSSTSSTSPGGSSGPGWTVDAGAPSGQPTGGACPAPTECVVGMGGDAASPFLLVDSHGTTSLASVAVPSDLPHFVPSQVSCPTPLRCISAGVSGPAQGAGAWPAVAVTTDGGRTWTVEVFRAYSGSALNAVACPTEQECFAAGSLYAARTAAEVLVSTDGGARWAAEPVAGPVGDVGALACWDASHCVGVGDVTSGGRLVGAALVTTSDGGSHWTSRSYPVTSAAGGLACPAPGRCVLVGSTGRTLSDFAPVALYTTDGSAWHDADLGRLPVVRLATVSCGSVALCVAVGQGQGSIGTPERGLQAGVILESTSTGAAWTSHRLPDGVGVLQMVACAASGFCVAGGAALSTPAWRLLLRH